MAGNGGRPTRVFMRIFAMVLLAFVSITVAAQKDTLKFRVSLTDKAATTYSLSKPQEFLSAKALVFLLKVLKQLHNSKHWQVSW
jgi:hypothetical protein